MRASRRHLAAAALLVAAGALSSLAPRSDARADAPTLHAAPSPAVEIAIAETTPLSEQTTVSWVSAAGASRRVAELAHPRDASVKGAVLPSTGEIVVALDADDARDRSFASALVVLHEGSAPRTLSRGVAHAAQPIVTDEGRVLIERGAPGPEARDLRGKLAQRIDDLEVTELDPSTGAARPLLTMSGYSAHVAGALGDDALVYRVGPGGADLVAVSRVTRALRVVADLGPLARDFVVDRAARALWFSVRHRDGTARLMQLDVATGASIERASSAQDPVPFALPGGGVGWTDERARVSTSGASLSLSLPPGAFLWGKAAGGGWIAGLVMPRGALPRPVLIDATSGAVAALPAASGARVQVLGLRAGGAK